MALRHALTYIDYDSLRPFQGMLRDGKYHGIGIGCFVKNTGLGPHEAARIAITAADRVEVALGITTLGQGHETTMAQICADTLGVPMESIAVLHGSTDLLPDGVGTFGSRGTVMAGNAVYLASQQLRDQILALTSQHLPHLDASHLTFHDGAVYRRNAAGEELCFSLEALFELARQTTPTSTDAAALTATAYFRAEHPTYSYGTHVAHVAIDPETGLLEIVRYVVVEDIGRCINPLLVHGQAVGGAVQGIGGTILEELVYDTSGQLLSGTLMDYVLPTSRDVPAVEGIILEAAPSPRNPLGVKGAGEGGTVATGAALANAVAHALAPLGVQVTELPLSPEKIRAWIREASTVTSR
jgi:carbon-monoxide dehydrogenase large subunit